MARDAVVGGEHLLLGQDEAQGRLELALGACSRAKPKPAQTSAGGRSGGALPSYHP